MWNYSLMLPSLMLLSVLIIYYLAHRRLPIRVNRVFLSMLLINSGTVLFDYISSRADENHAAFSAATLYALNIGFFAFYFARIYVIYLFILSVVESSVKLPPFVLRLSPVLFILMELVTFTSPLHHAVFSIDPVKGYVSGPFYSLLYICFFFYLASGFVLVFIAGKHLTKQEFLCLLFPLIILCVGNIFRLLLPSVILMNTFCLMAILVFFLGFENPDLYLTNGGSAFNTQAFEALLGEWHKKKTYSLLGFVIKNYTESKGIYGGAQMDHIIRLLSEDFSLRYPDYYLFYLRNGCFCIAGPASMATKRISEEIFEHCAHPFETGGPTLTLHLAFVELDSDMGAYSSDRIASAMQLALDSAGHDAEDAHHLTVRDINDYLNDKMMLEEALEKGGVEVYLQPLIDSATGKVIAAEALARLHAADNRVLPPSRFIPIAEKDGSITALGEQVLSIVCGYIEAEELNALGLKWINVNLSPSQCLRGDLSDRFLDILSAHHVQPEFIHLELTEQAFEDYSVLKDQILKLQRMGFQFALDDYGSGYSNLTRVRQYPFHNIKIDMEVVWAYFRSRDLLLPTMIRSFRQMGYSITAEGVETEEMARELAGIGCDYLQGYYYSKPIPYREFISKYSSSNSPCGSGFEK